MYFLRKQLPPLSSLLPFEAAARLQSITKAADELCLTQAAISKQIRVLEENLGTRLFERRNRAIHLTEEGSDLHQVVRASLSELAASSQRIRDSQVTSEIVLRSQQCEALYWLMPRLSDFYQKHPDIELRVGVSTKPIDEADAPFDLALQSIERNRGTAELLHVAPDEIFPVCSPGYFTGANPPRPLEDLQKCQLLHHHVTPQDWMTWDRWLERLNFTTIKPESSLVFDSYPMLIQAAIEGHGVALGWQRTCEHLLETGKLVRPFDESLTIADGLGIFASSQTALSSDVQSLLSWLKTALQPNQNLKERN